MLGLELTETEGFRLILATYDDPRRRDELIERLVADGRTQRLLVTRLDLAALGKGTVLLRALREHVAATKTPPGWRHTVMVVGLEDLLDYRRIGARADALTALHDANLHRDAFPVACPAPVVIWLSPIATSAFAQAAPDLWHWRTATFDFTDGPGRRVGLLEETLSSREHRSDDVPRDVLERRVTLLHELLLEIEREGDDSPGRRARKVTLLDQLVWTYLLLDRSHDALPCAEQQLAIAREIGDRRGEGIALGNLGNAYAELGEARRAIELFEQGLAIARELGNRRSEGKALFNSGLALDALGDREAAKDRVRAALAIFEQIEDAPLEKARALLAKWEAEARR